MRSRKTETELVLPVLKQSTPPTIADQIFETLQHRILTLELPPNTKISETEVAMKMGVSRQPVREAFKRLSKRGFLNIRPQSGSKVSLISQESVLRSRYIRIALEIQTCQTAAEIISGDGIAKLRCTIDEQRAAITKNDRVLFHQLDDRFHREICHLAGVGYVWDLTRDHKAHMDRVRMLSLDETTLQFALDEHIQILNAIVSRDAMRITIAVKSHFSRILTLIDDLKAKNHDWFTDAEP